MSSQSFVGAKRRLESAAISNRHSVRSLACPICGKPDWEFTRRVRAASISKCMHCGLLGTTDFLTRDTTTDGIYETSELHHSSYEAECVPYRQPMYERVLPSLERFRRTGRLLEIGCSYGYFLETARRAGWRAEGVEISSYACEVSRSKGFQIHQGELSSLPLRAASYDVVAMWDVIEHLTDPAGIVECCARLLFSGGALVARTPNAQALAPRSGLGRLLYGHLAYPANTREHIFHFTPQSLSQLLRHKGFQDVEIDEYGGWEERIIGGRNMIIRMGRHLLMRYALCRQWPYEFCITAVKGASL